MSISKEKYDELVKEVVDDHANWETGTLVSPTIFLLASIEHFARDDEAYRLELKRSKIEMLDFSELDQVGDWFKVIADMGYVQVKQFYEDVAERMIDVYAPR